MKPIEEYPTKEEWWRDCIREYGISAACEWFGHERDSHFTVDTIGELGGDQDESR